MVLPPLTILSQQDLKRTKRASRVFYRGQRVRWNPPAGAYSPNSRQHQSTGMEGVVTFHHGDSVLMVRLDGDRGEIRLNTDYVEAL